MTMTGTDETRRMPQFEEILSNRAKAMKASEIRELLKLTQRPEIISFAGGLPNPEAFPVERVQEIITDLLKTNPGRILQYGSTEGVLELREEIASRLKRIWGMEGDPDNIIITVGSQQGLDLLGKIFIGSTSTIIMEAPTYLGALNAFRVYDPTIVSVPLDDNGLEMDALEDKLKALKDHGANLKFLYTVPTFHNPAGVCMSGTRRRRLIDLAHEYDLLIVEDDPYGELRYTGDALPTLASMDREDRVIYLGTFSKTLVPGFRIAWTFGPKPVVQKMVIAKQAVDLCAPPFTQHIAMEYLRRGHIDDHIVKIIELYGRKQRIMLSSMEKYMPREYISWTKPEGGMFLWARLSEGIDTSKMLNDAIGKNVAYVTGSSFFADGSGRNCMRINFTHASDERIVEGVQRLAGVIEEWGKNIEKEGSKDEPEVITGV
ncbi:MAG: PLP-dependent aminotransferase family protein [Candidatus Thermoplasmatota archaeon]|nr:PLP-dependent aminotransferase family protein [Candidatus Thermoplasmatota archaeon]